MTSESHSPSSNNVIENHSSALFEALDAQATHSDLHSKAYKISQTDGEWERETARVFRSSSQFFNDVNELFVIATPFMWILNIQHLHDTIFTIWIDGNRLWISISQPHLLLLLFRLRDYFDLLTFGANVPHILFGNHFLCVSVDIVCAARAKPNSNGWKPYRTCWLITIISSNDGECIKSTYKYLHKPKIEPKNIERNDELTKMDPISFAQKMS